MKSILTALTALKSGEGLRGQLMRGGVGSLGVRVGASLLQVVVAIVLARFLGAQGYGAYSFVIATVSMLVIPAQMGLPQLVVRETAKAQEAKRWSALRGLWRWSTYWSLSMSLVIVPLAAFAAFAFTDWLPLLHSANIYWALALVPLIALSSLRAAALRGLGFVVQGLLPEFILRPLVLIVLVFGFVWIYGPASFDASTAILMNLSAVAVTFVIGAVLLVRAQPKPMLQEPARTFTPSVWMASALPLGFTEAVYIVNINAGIVILGIVASAEEAAMFRAAMQAAVPLVLGAHAIDTLTAPYFAKFYQSKNDRIGRIFRVSQLVSFGVALPVAVGYFIAGKQLLGLVLGPEFIAAYVPLLILTVVRLTGAGLGPASMLLRMTGHEMFVLQMATISLVGNIALLVLFAPTFGASGVAVATGMSSLFLSIAAFLKAWKMGLILQKSAPRTIQHDHGEGN